jgi:protein-arginine kinase activator protein McsA
MEAQLKKAIDEEDYETAARLRDEIARMRSEN